MTDALKTVRSEFRVNATTRNAQEDAAIAARPDGGFQIVWESAGQDGDGLGVYYRDFSAGGRAQGREKRINTLTEGDQQNPDVAFDEDGNGVWAWESTAKLDYNFVGGERVPEFDGLGLPQIRIKGFDYPGDALNEEYWIFDSPEQRNTSPQLALLADGEFALGYNVRSDRPNTDTAQFNFAQTIKFDAGGRFTDIFTHARTPSVASEPGVVTGGPEITPLDSGGYLLLWEEAQDTARTGSFLRAEVIGPGGYFDKETDFEVVSSGLIGPAFDGHATQLKNGTIAITWMELNAASARDFDFDIWVQLYSDSGELLTNKILAHEASDLPQAFPNIAALKDGGFLVTYSDFSNADGGTTAAPAGVFAQRFDKNGIKLGDGVQINDTKRGNQEQSDLAVLKNGNVVVTWESTSGIDGPRDVYAEVLSVPGYGAGQAQILTGYDGRNRIDGGAKNDVISGDAGNDVLLGGKGNDVVRGGDDNDTLKGGDGNDTLFGGEGRDVLDGGKGNDVINGAVGNDRMKGGPGRDTFIFADGKDLITDFRDNTDTVRIEQSLAGGLNMKKLGRLADESKRGEVSFDFGADELTIKGVSDFADLRNDIEFI